MATNDFKGSFLGFTFGDKHSSEFNIVRVSNNNRYSGILGAQTSDLTTDVPGGDGVYYFKTNKKQFTIPVDFAFECLDDEQLSAMRKWLNQKEIHNLIFDETKYKKYKVKVNGTPNIKYIAFNEQNKRIYKGEGSVEFISYTPYAYSVANSIANLPTGTTAEEYAGSGLPEKESDWTSIANNMLTIKNYGEFDAPFMLSAVSNSNTLTFKLGDTTICTYNTLIKDSANAYPFTYNSQTGLLKCGNQILVPSSGNSIINVPVGETIKIEQINTSVSCNLTFEYRYGG